MGYQRSATPTLTMGSTALSISCAPLCSKPPHSRQNPRLRERERPRTEGRSPWTPQTLPFTPPTLSFLTSHMLLSPLVLVLSTELAVFSLNSRPTSQLYSSFAIILFELGASFDTVLTVSWFYSLHPPQCLTLLCCSVYSVC